MATLISTLGYALCSLGYAVVGIATHILSNFMSISDSSERQYWNGPMATKGDFGP